MGHPAASCVHFNGVQHKTCNAGVLYVDVRDSSGKSPYRWPCLTIVGERPCTTTCAQYRAKSAEEIAAEEREFEMMMEVMRTRDAADLCTHCAFPIARRRQEIGRASCRERV